MRRSERIAAARAAGVAVKDVVRIETHGHTRLAHLADGRAWTLPGPTGPAPANDGAAPEPAPPEPAAEPKEPAPKPKPKARQTKKKESP